MAIDISQEVQKSQTQSKSIENQLSNITDVRLFPFVLMLAF